MTTRLRKRTWTLLFVAPPSFDPPVDRDQADARRDKAVGCGATGLGDGLHSHRRGTVCPAATAAQGDRRRRRSLSRKRYPDPASFKTTSAIAIASIRRRFRAMFAAPFAKSGSTTGRIPRRLGAALQRFPACGVSRCTAAEYVAPVGEGVGTAVPARLRELPELETLHLRSLDHGRGHRPTLRTPASALPRDHTGTGTGLTPACLKTFAAIPNLKEFEHRGAKSETASGSPRTSGQVGGNRATGNSDQHGVKVNATAITARSTARAVGAPPLPNTL